MQSIRRKGTNFIERIKIYSVAYFKVGFVDYTENKTEKYNKRNEIKIDLLIHLYYG